MDADCIWPLGIVVNCLTFFAVLVSMSKYSYTRRLYKHALLRLSPIRMARIIGQQQRGIT